MSAVRDDTPAGGYLERLGHRLLRRLGLSEHVGSEHVGEEARKSDGDGLTSLARRLAAGAGVVTALLTLLGITGGQLDRVLRNDPLLSLIAIGLLGLGILMGIAVSDMSAAVRTDQVIPILVLGLTFVVLAATAVYLTLQASNPILLIVVFAFLAGTLLALWRVLRRVINARAIALSAGVLLFLAGIVVLSVVSVASKATKERPRVTGTLIRNAAGWMLEGRVSAQGLTRREHILIVVEGVSSTVPLAAGRAGREYNQSLVQSKNAATDDYDQTLTFTRVGPDSEGKVDVPVKASVSIGSYERVRIAAWLFTERYTKDLKRYEKKYDQLWAQLQDAYQKWEMASEKDRPKLVDHYWEVRKTLDQHIADNSDKIEMASRCAEEKPDRTCLVFTLPQSSTRPVLAMTPSGNHDHVRLRVRTGDLNPDDVVEVRMMANRRRIWLARLSPMAGKVDETVTLAIDPPTHICAVARILRRPIPKAPSPNESRSLAVSSHAPKKSSKPTLRCGVRWQPWNLATDELSLLDP